MRKENKIYAVTGGIGSGKSTVLNIIKSLNYKTLSCDDVLVELYSNQKFLAELKTQFPYAVTGDKTLSVDKKKIAGVCFNDNKEYDKLTKFVTYRIYDDIKAKAKKCAETTFIEIPLLFELNKQDEFDGVIIVKRDLTERINSVKQRSNLTEEEILKRINKQFNYDSIDIDKYFIIVNDGSFENLKQKTVDIINSL